MTEHPRQTKHCGRLGRHLAHYWQGSKIFDVFHGERGRWIRLTYWCSGFIKTEGGHNV